MVHKYTPEQAEFIINNLAGRNTYELTDLVNQRYDINLSRNQIRAFIKNRKLSSGINGRFKQGQTPFNKGKKKFWVGGEETQFKKGNVPVNYRPIGSERINVDGYVEIKIADPGKWRLKHQVVWEKANGQIPKGYVVIFGDGNQLNLELGNIILVSKKQLLVLNRHKLLQKDADLTKTAIIIANLYLKISDVKKSH